MTMSLYQDRIPLDERVARRKATEQREAGTLGELQTTCVFVWLCFACMNDHHLPEMHYQCCTRLIIPAST